MPKSLSHIVAALVIPCLLADPALTITFSSPMQTGIFAEQALAPQPVEAFRPAKNSIAARLARLYPHPPFKPASPLYWEYVELAVQALRALGFKRVTHYQVAVLLGTNPSTLLKHTDRLQKLGITQEPRSLIAENIPEADYKKALQIIAATNKKPTWDLVLQFLGARRTDRQVIRITRPSIFNLFKSKLPPIELPKPENGQTRIEPTIQNPRLLRRWQIILSGILNRWNLPGSFLERGAT